MEKKKSEVKFRAGGKIEAPRRFWPPNRRGACPNFNFFFPIFPNLSYSMNYVGSEAVTDVVDNNHTSVLAF